MTQDRVVVLVTGDRHWNDYFAIRMVLDGLLVRYGERLVIVEGEAPGADTMARDWALYNGLTVANGRLRPYPAHWRHTEACVAGCAEVCGRPAGAIRNRKMLKMENPDLVVGFHNQIEASKGTKDMLTIATKAGKPAYLFGRFGLPALLP